MYRASDYMVAVQLCAPHHNSHCHLSISHLADDKACESPSSSRQQRAHSGYDWNLLSWSACLPATMQRALTIAACALLLAFAAAPFVTVTPFFTCIWRALMHHCIFDAPAPQSLGWLRGVIASELAFEADDIYHSCYSQSVNA